MDPPPAMLFVFAPRLAVRDCAWLLLCLFVFAGVRFAGFGDEGWERARGLEPAGLEDMDVLGGLLGCGPFGGLRPLDAARVTRLVLRPKWLGSMTVVLMFSERGWLEEGGT